MNSVRLAIFRSSYIPTVSELPPKLTRSRPTPKTICMACLQYLTNAIIGLRNGFLMERNYFLRLGFILWTNALTFLAYGFASYPIDGKPAIFELSKNFIVFVYNSNIEMFFHISKILGKICKNFARVIGFEPMLTTKGGCAFRYTKPIFCEV